AEPAPEADRVCRDFGIVTPPCRPHVEPVRPRRVERLGCNHARSEPDPDPGPARNPVAIVAEVELAADERFDRACPQRRSGAHLAERARRVLLEDDGLAEREDVARVALELLHGLDAEIGRQRGVRADLEIAADAHPDRPAQALEAFVRNRRPGDRIIVDVDIDPGEARTRLDERAAELEAIAGIAAKAPGGRVELSREARSELAVGIDPVDLADRVEVEIARLERAVKADVRAVELERVEAGVELDVRAARAECDPEDRSAALIVEAGLDAFEILVVAGVEHAGRAD